MIVNWSISSGKEHFTLNNARPKSLMNVPRILIDMDKKDCRDLMNLL